MTFDAPTVQDVADNLIDAAVARGPSAWRDTVEAQCKRAQRARAQIRHHARRATEAIARNDQNSFEQADAARRFARAMLDEELEAGKTLADAVALLDRMTGAGK